MLDSSHKFKPFKYLPVYSVKYNYTLSLQIQSTTAFVFFSSNS